MDLAELGKIVDRVVADLYTFARALETFRPVGVRAEEKVLEKFNNNYSANVVNFLQTALHRDALMAMSRMWDGGKRVQSIPRVVRELQSAEVVDEIKAKRREAMLAILESAEMAKLVRVPEDREIIERRAHEDGDKAAAAVDDRVAEVRAMCDDPALRELLDRNINWRHKNVAHALETTRMEDKATKSGVAMVDPKWGELYDIKTMTNPIVKRLMVLVADTSIFPGEYEKIFARYADAFWGSFVETPQ